MSYYNKNQARTFKSFLDLSECAVSCMK